MNQSHQINPSISYAVMESVSTLLSQSCNQSVTRSLIHETTRLFTSRARVPVAPQTSRARLSAVSSLTVRRVGAHRYNVPLGCGATGQVQHSTLGDTRVPTSMHSGEYPPPPPPTLPPPPPPTHTPFVKNQHAKELTHTHIPVVNFVCFIYLLFLICQAKGLSNRGPLLQFCVLAEHVGGAVSVHLVDSKDKLWIRGSFETTTISS